MIRKAQFNWERSLIKMPPNLLVTFYFAMLVVVTMKVYKTNLVTYCHPFPVIMMSSNTAASLLLEPLINMHLMICQTLFKTNCHIYFNIKRFCLNRGCGTTAEWKTILNVNLLQGENPRPAVTHIEWLPGLCQQTFPKLKQFLNSAGSHW